MTHINGLLTRFSLVLGASAALSGCALLRSAPEPISEPAIKSPEQAKIDKLETALAQLQSKVDGLEEEIAANQSPKRRTSTTNVESTELVQSSVALTDPEKGFTQDNAVLSLRQSKVLYDSEKFPEAVLGFATFVERHASHPLASQAQYYLADSYFKQNDYPVAEKEFRKLLRDYPQTNFASQARQRLRICAENSAASATKSAPAAAPKASGTPVDKTSRHLANPGAATPGTGTLETAPTEEMATAQSSALRRAEPESRQTLIPAAANLDLAPIEEAPTR